MTTAILITDAFPLSSITERAFVVPEIEALATAYERVIVMPTTSMGAEDAVELPKNVEICRHWVDSTLWRDKWRRLRFLFTPELWLRCGKPRSYTNLTFIAASMAFERVFTRWLAANRIDLDRTYIETFWFDFPTCALGHLRCKFPNLRYTSRAHGHDIYTHRAKAERERAIAQADGVYTVAEHGKEFLRTMFPAQANKIDKARLGCVKLYPDEMAQHHTVADRKLTFVSVARVSPEKRVELNLEMLRKLAVARPSTSIRWIHIGDGPLMESLRAKVGAVTEPNLEIALLGALPNEATQRVLISEPVDWMLLMSETEGLPICLCEALSYGIPVIATEVGGTPEIVDDECGILLAANPTGEEFVRGLLPYIESDFRMGRMREAAYRLWNEEFDATRLRWRFIDDHRI